MEMAREALDGATLEPGGVVGDMEDGMLGALLDGEAEQVFGGQGLASQRGPSGPSVGATLGLMGELGQTDVVEGIFACAPWDVLLAHDEIEG